MGTGNALLLNMLARAAAFDGEYGEQLSNHLPMALIALSKLGAGPQRLEEFFQVYSQRLRTKVARSSSITSQDWRVHLGGHERHSDYVAFFSGELTRLGTENLLSSYVPELMPGVAGGAFHGLIRLSYGVDIANDSEIVEGLSHWAVTFLPLAALRRIPDLNGLKSGRETLAALSSDSYWMSADVDAPNIFSRMAKVAKDPRFIATLTCMPSSDLAELADLAVDVFAATASFTALHMVTSCHALRILWPFVGDPRATRFHFWTAFKAAYATIRCPFVPESSADAKLPDWPTITEKAVQTLDDHTIKLVFTCMQEEAAYRSLKHRAIAARRVGLIQD